MKENTTECKNNKSEKKKKHEKKQVAKVKK